MQREIQADNVTAAYGLNAAAETATRNNADQVSKAGSSVSKPVMQSNMEQLHEFRSQLGLIKKNRPKEDAEMPAVSVTTPIINEDLDRLSTMNAPIDPQNDV